MATQAVHKTRPRSGGRRPSAPDAGTRELILDTATRLFSDQGIAATTVAQIAKAAGVTSAMVHYYFTNRETLLDVVVEERIARAIEHVWAPAADRAYDDPFRLATEFVQRLVGVAERMPWLPSLWMREIINEGGLLSERVLPRLPLEHFRRFWERVAAAQRAGQVNDQLSPPLLQVSILTLVMTSLATAKTLQRVTRAPALEYEVLRRHVVALVTGGMQPSHPRRAGHSRSEEHR